MDDVKTFVARIEKQEEEKAEIAASIIAIYKEAESKGFDPKALREIIKWRKAADKEEFATRRVTIEKYAHALGMLVGTPLGDAAMRVAKAVDDGRMSIAAPAE